MGESSIEWTNATWNPVRGCVKVSPGCKHCYAETFAERWRGVKGHAYEQGFDLRIVPHKLGEPLTWRKPRRVFVNSMSDLFQEGVPDGYVMDVFRVMREAGWHTYQVLTKRADRMAAWVDRWVDTSGDDARDFANARGPDATRAAYSSQRAHLFAEMLDRWGAPPAGAAFPTYDWADGPRYWPRVFRNVHLGVSVEDRKYGLPRIDILRTIPAAVRFLSIEPLLEDLGTIDLTDIGWVIVGSESGHGARPMNEDWVRSIRDQCEAAAVPFFYKQRTEGRQVVSLPMLDGVRHQAFPEARA